MERTGFSLSMYCGVVIHTQSTTTTTTTTTTTVILFIAPMLAPRSVPAARAFAAAEHELRTAEALDWRAHLWSVPGLGAVLTAARLAAQLEPLAT